MKKFSLISTLYNEENNIIQFLESYKKQTKKADEYIIVDGGSTDKTVELIRGFANNNPDLNIKLIIDETCSIKYTKGPVAKGRNVAIENAKHEYIIGTDAGCVLPANWLEEIIKPFDDDSIDVVSGWCKGLEENEFQKFFAKYCMPTLESVNRGEFLPSSRNIAFKKSCWEKVGKYPEKTLTAEDTIYDLKLKEAGFKFSFNENAIVYWDLPRNIKEAYHKLYAYGYGDGQYMIAKYRYFLRFLCLILPVKFYKLLFSNPKNFAFKYICLFANVKGYVAGLFNKVD